MSKRSLLSIVAATLLLQACGSDDSGTPAPEQDGSPKPTEGEQPSSAGGEAELSVNVLSRDLASPWGMAFLPGNRILVTEKAGRLRIFDLATQQLGEPLTGVPAVANQGQGGLLDVVLHPDFATNQLVYLSYAAGADGLYGTEVGRGRLTDSGLQDFEKIFEAKPKVAGGLHFGSRLVFDQEKYLFITLGDRGQQDEAQNLSSHMGTVIRLHDDGSVPTDNPFLNEPGALPEIYSYGHRNIQGADLNPWTGEVWTHEHGPQGGDEVNVIKAGANYGWPVITYGVNYGTGTPIGEGQKREGMEQPLFYWDPSIAPSGMAFYNYQAIPQWQGDLLVGALKFQLLSVLDVDGTQVDNERRLLEEEHGRIRAVEVNDSGQVYLLTDGGGLIQIASAQP